MKLINQSFVLPTFTAIILMIVYSYAAAENTGNEEEEEEEDEEITQLTQPANSISFGIGQLNGTREQFGIYDKLRYDKSIVFLDADINLRNDTSGSWITAHISNGGIDNRKVKLRYDLPGKWGIGLNYYQIPKSSPYTVNTGMTGLGTTNQAVPLDGEAYIPGTGNNVVLATERKGTDLLINTYLTPKFNFKVNFKNEKKEGNRHWGRGGAAEFAAEPIVSTIRELNVILDYYDKNFQLNGGFYGSWYDNKHTMITTKGQNGEENSTYYLSLPLSNQASQIYLNGGYNFTSSTRATYRVSYTHATVDEHLPTADIAGLAASASPNELDAAINTTSMKFGLTARPLAKLNLIANLRYHKVDE